jgi:urea transport system permease protein
MVNYAKTYLTSAFPEAWLYALGALFILVTIFLPKGIVGIVSAWKSKAIEPDPDPEPQPVGAVK